MSTDIFPNKWCILRLAALCTVLHIGAMMQFNWIFYARNPNMREKGWCGNILGVPITGAPVVSKCKTIFDNQFQYWSIQGKEILRKRSLTFEKHVGSYYSEYISTGKSLSVSLVLASANPQYDDRLVFVLTFRTINVQNMVWTWNFHVCTDLVIQWTIFCHIMG